MKPYTYLIGWSKVDKYYYGVQYGEKSHPDNLWETYFTSSKKVKILRKELGEPDIIQIRKVFDCAEHARSWETKVINRMNLVSDTRFLNQTDNTGNFYWEGPRGEFSEEHKKKISAAQKGKKISKEHAKALHEGRRKSKNSMEHNKAIAENNRTRILSEESRKNMSKSALGRKMSASTKEKLRRSSTMSEEQKIVHSIRMKMWWAERKAKNNGSS